jgi:hypothetical protein
MKIILSQFCKVDIETVLYPKPIKWDELIKRALNGMIFFATKHNTWVVICNKNEYQTPSVIYSIILQ